MKRHLVPILYLEHAPPNILLPAPPLALRDFLRVVLRDRDAAVAPYIIGTFTSLRLGEQVASRFKMKWVEEVKLYRKNAFDDCSIDDLLNCI